MRERERKGKIGRELGQKGGEDLCGEEEKERDLGAMK